MRICLVSSEYPPETGWGGIGTYTYTIAHGLIKLGHEVHVIAYAPDKEIEYLDKEVRVYRIRQKKIKWAGRFEKSLLLSTLLYSIRVSGKIKELIDRYKLEIVEAPEWGSEAFWYSLNKTIPLIVRFHTPRFLIQELNSLPWTFRVRLLCLLEKIAALRADLLTSPSRAMAEIIAKKYNIAKSKIKVIANPIDKDYFLPSGVENKLTVLFVGRLEYRKGAHILAKAIPEVIKTFPDAKFIFIGNDSPSSPEKGSMMEYLLRIANGAKNLQFIGHTDRDKLLEYYRKSTICVFPSLWEAFGYTALEAMACGKPTIITDRFGISEFLSRDALIQVKPQDHMALAKAITDLLGNLEMRERLSKNSREAAVEYFSQESITNKYVEMLQQYIFAAAGNKK